MRPLHHSNNNETDVDPRRLIAAADTILAAEITGGSVSMWRDDARPSREGFSSLELVQAMIFLRRLGLVEDPRQASSTSEGRPPK